MKKKSLTIGIILLFIGVAIAPSINFNVVKASNQTVESSNQLPIVEQYQVNDQVLQKEMTQSSNSECGCENENPTPWIPIICVLCMPLIPLAIALDLFLGLTFIGKFLMIVDSIFNCPW